MIALTKINGEIIVINSKQIEHIDVIPESKITMMNGKYYIVRESVAEIIDKEIQFNRKIVDKITRVESIQKIFKRKAEGKERNRFYNNHRYRRRLRRNRSRYYERRQH